MRGMSCHCLTSHLTPGCTITTPRRMVSDIYQDVTNSSSAELFWWKALNFFLHHWPHCMGNPPVTGGFPSQRASDSESCYHHEKVSINSNILVHNEGHVLPLLHLTPHTWLYDNNTQEDGIWYLCQAVTASVQDNMVIWDKLNPHCPEMVWWGAHEWCFESYDLSSKKTRCNAVLVSLLQT